MDLNKLEQLRKVEYDIQKCCFLCKHSEFPNNDWGTCKINQYQHKKHSDSERNMSIYKYGVCNKMEVDEIKLKGLGMFDQFYWR